MRCTTCNGDLPYEKRKNKFCSRSCAATFNNGANVAPKRTLGRSEVINECLICGAQTKGKFCSTRCSADNKIKVSDRRLEAGLGTCSQTLRRYLIKLHGTRCLNPNCAWDFDKIPVAVELEHIDGDADNNTLSNLTLLCPNCHSLTPTYKNRNMGNGRAKRRRRYAEGKSY